MILVLSCVFHPEPVVSAQISKDLADTISVTNQIIVICPKPTRPAGTSYNVKDSEGSLYKRIILKSFIHPRSSFFGRMIESISFGRATRIFIKEQNKEISVVYANTWPLFAQYAVTKTCKELNIPLVLHVQDI